MMNHSAFNVESVKRYAQRMCMFFMKVYISFISINVVYAKNVSILVHQMHYKKAGKNILQRIWLRCLRDMPYYQQNGGITFSGGEPLLQASFVAKTADLCRKKGVNTIAIDTAGNVDWKAFEAVLPFVDYVLYDVKAASEEIHRKATGFSNHKILDNLHRLDSCGKKIFIRIPLIPTINDDLKEIEAIAQLAAQLHTLEEIRIVPYHTFGREKYKTIGLSEPALFPIPDDQKIIHYERIIQAMQKKKHHP